MEVVDRVRNGYEIPKIPHLESDFNEQLMLSVVGTTMGRHGDVRV